MTFSLPISLIRLHETFVDELIDGVVGTICKLVYPPTFTECLNCYLDNKTGRSANIYKSGGPYPFTSGTLCSYCGGEGRQTKQEEEQIRVRFYTDPKSWILMEIRVANPDGIGQLIGYMTDLPKIQRGVALIVNTPSRGIKEWKYEPYSEPIYHGFHHDRYFIQLWKRVG